jgi:3-oxoacyl-[acyl-carrier protein] reductase
VSAGADDDRPRTLITGTSKGIGKGLAEHYLGRGHFVIGCSRSATTVEHPRYRHFACDVGDERAVVALFSAVAKEFGHVDHLINNAAVARMNPALLTPMDALERSFRTNTFGTFLFCREAARLMMRRQYGRIVNFSTIAVPFRLDGESVYAASKAAVVSITEILARELAPYHITVNAVGPSAVDTDLIKNIPRAIMERLLSRLAIRRKGTVADVANAVDFFLSRESGLVTGQTLYLGGP